MSKYFIKLSLAVIFITKFINVYNQEIVDYRYNSAYNYNKSLLKNNNSEIKDTAVKLPFIDDFSYNSSSPDPNLWKDKHVLINTAYAPDYISKGIATFDMLDSEGKLREELINNTARADTLTSQYIDLFEINREVIPGSEMYIVNSTSDTVKVEDSLYYKPQFSVIYNPVNKNGYYYDTSQTLYKKSGNNYIEVNPNIYYKLEGVFKEFPPYTYFASISDSLYLSFYLMSGGLLDNIHQETDSMIVEFFAKDDSIKWHKVFDSIPYSDTNWHFVSIPIKEEKYLNDSFKFRFINITSYAKEEKLIGHKGNADQWHLDYVYLDAKRFYNDSSINDFCFSSGLGSLIEDYNAMPWQHFRNTLAFSLRKSELLTDVNNLSSNEGYLLDFRIRTLLPDNSVITQKYKGEDYIGKLNAHVSFTDYFQYEYLLDYNTSVDSAEFFVEASYLPSFTTNEKDLISYNDTTTHIQRFFNYYSYDDGSAESSYGVSSPNEEFETYFAMNFRIYKTDTLRALDIDFAPIDNSSDIDEDYFYINVWANNNGSPGLELYRENTDNNGNDNNPRERGNNEFARYKLKNPVILPAGEYYIGLSSPWGYNLKVGLDLHNDNSNRLIYKYSSNWQPSTIAGTPMIRPVVGKKLPVGISDYTYGKADINIYPNPASEFLKIYSSEPINSISIYNSRGTIVESNSVFNNSINISNLSKGFYLLKIFTENGNIYTSKFIKK